MQGVRVPMLCLLDGLSLPGWMQTARTVAMAQPECAIAIAGGFSPRARRDQATLTHTDSSGWARVLAPRGSPLSPGNTVLVAERWS
jgi:hypothetical protein